MDEQDGLSLQLRIDELEYNAKNMADRIYTLNIERNLLMEIVNNVLEKVNERRR